MLTFLLACATAPTVPEATAPPAVAPAALPAAAPAAPGVVAPPTVPAAAPSAGPDPARAAADEAFNEAMTAHEAGAATAPEALRRALAAYQSLDNVDSDGLFHVGLLQLALDDAPGARASADRILADTPDHLFALDVAARAAEATGDLAATKGYYLRVRAAAGKPAPELPEYAHHQRLLLKIEARASAWLAVHEG